MSQLGSYIFYWAVFRGFVEDFENSSFTRPSGGVFEVKLAKIQKMKKGFVELYLSFVVVVIFQFDCLKTLTATTLFDLSGFSFNFVFFIVT